MDEIELDETVFTEGSTLVTDPICTQPGNSNGKPDIADGWKTGGRQPAACKIQLRQLGCSFIRDRNLFYFPEKLVKK